MAATHAAAFTRSRPWSAAEFASLLDQAFCHVLGDARCFALIRVIADEAELLTIATHPDAQRQGLARHRMTLWQDRAAELGATRAFLEVASDNQPALALYTACGFDPCGRRPGYYPRAAGQPVDAILMARTLDRHAQCKSPKSH